MKIVAIIKRVEDPEIKIKIKGDGSGIETDAMKYVVNPFDEIAVEEAIRLRDTHGGELAVLCVGPQDATQQIRTGLAMGGDRGIHIVADNLLDPLTEATAIAKVLGEEKPDLILLGKQSVDDDQGQVGVMLADKLDFAQLSFASKEESLESDNEKKKVAALKVADGRLESVREVDGGLETVSVSLPAVVTTELRLNVPRYASLPGIMKAKKKPIDIKNLADLGAGEGNIKILKMENPPTRQAGTTVPDVATLIDKLRNDAKVI